LNMQFQDMTKVHWKGNSNMGKFDKIQQKFNLWFSWHGLGWFIILHKNTCRRQLLDQEKWWYKVGSRFETIYSIKLLWYIYAY
jgi:hypothetical protein